MFFKFCKNEKRNLFILPTFTSITSKKQTATTKYRLILGHPLAITRLEKKSIKYTLDVAKRMPFML